MSQPAILPRASLHDILVGGIRELVEKGDLQPGQKIPEQQLCERFGVSRTPLREALKVLAAEGMLELRPRRGAIVASISHADIDELFPIMGALEALAGEMLCRRITDAEISQLQRLHERMQRQYEKGDEPGYLASNRQFHEKLFEFCGNATLRNLYVQILLRIRSFRFVVRKTSEQWRQAMDEHRLIMAAVAARDVRRLPRLLKAHVTGITAEIARDMLKHTMASEEDDQRHQE
ncbi:GntR family transcriptional regulator [Roseomonas gilardii]|uniref:GntR family transcriptional regulator n=1 Tax=Roseomonas gilardii TaxID=257708 RepID=UPI00119DFD64|nr:GntR family transcriptional regulator [Roseomonas gilardii]